MRYLSIDLEATGLKENSLIIEFAAIPFDAKSQQLEDDLALEFIIHCPSFEELKPTLDPWVIEHNEHLIRRSHRQGIPLEEFKRKLTNYLESNQVKDFFGKDKIKLFGKSMNAIDISFLKRDCGWDWYNKYFHHRQLDLSSVCLSLIDLGLLAPGSDSGTVLMNYFGMGEVAHTALEDARNTAIMYLNLVEKFKVSPPASNDGPGPSNG